MDRVMLSHFAAATSSLHAFLQSVAVEVHPSNELFGVSVCVECVAPARQQWPWSAKSSACMTGGQPRQRVSLIMRLAGHCPERRPQLQGAGLGVPLDSAAPAQRQQPGSAGHAARAAVQGQQVPVCPPGVAASPGGQVAAAHGAGLHPPQQERLPRYAPCAWIIAS